MACTCPCDATDLAQIEITLYMFLPIVPRYNLKFESSKNITRNKCCPGIFNQVRDSMTLSREKMHGHRSLMLKAIAIIVSLINALLFHEDRQYIS